MLFAGEVVMIQKKLLINVFTFSLLYLGMSSSLFAATVYIDNTLSSSCSGNYSIANRTCNGSDGAAYLTIQSGINNCSIGDVIYMREGTYDEIAIDIPESLNGTDWAPGSFTTLMSYPGEWAVVDGTGLNMSAHWTQQAVFTHPTGYGTGEEAQYTKYWRFSNFEVTGGRTGFFLKVDHVKWQYMYIHDNGRDRGTTDTLIAGILSVCPQYAIIEYSYFKDNIQTAGSDMNNSNILFDSDYEDSAGTGGAFNPNASTHHNIVRYNYLIGSRVSLRQKNQQRFGYNDRDPNDMTYKEYGDRWHHNIIFDANESIGASQDFIQIYNNITDSTVNFGRASGSSGDVPIIYNGVIYNNTVKRDDTDSSYGSFVTSGGHDTSKYNFYDSGTQKTVHEHVWFLNNIASGNSSAYQDFPFMLHWNIPANSDTPNQDNSNLILKRNLIHNNNNSREVVIGHNYDSSYTGCNYQYQTVDSANLCLKTWTGDNEVINWISSASTLFNAVEGTEQYKINPTFSLDSVSLAGATGLGSNHPYLTDSLPDYIGAVSPDDNAWVEGVLNGVSSIDWLMSQVVDSQDWSETGSGQSVILKVQGFQLIE